MSQARGTAGQRSRFCHLCGQGLAGRYYRYENGLVCCATCQATRPRCARCNLPLDDASLARAARAGEPRLCGDCWQSALRCNSCHQPIAGSWTTFEEMLQATPVRNFCEQCVRQQPRCDICRVPVGKGTKAEPDGLYRCERCTATMVREVTDAHAVYTEATARFARLVDAPLRQAPRLEVVSRREMGEVRRRYEQHLHLPSGEAPGTGSHHVLGFFVAAHGDSAIYVERRLPRQLLLGTLVHELAHAWQAEYAPGVRDPELCEGFAEWAAHGALVASGEQHMAARATRRDDLYGRGLRRFLAAQRTGGRAKALALARGKV